MNPGPTNVGSPASEAQVFSGWKRVLEILDAGPGITVQDTGRPGWKRFGLPCGGAMDRHAAWWANSLAGNSDGAPLLEMLFSGARFRVCEDCRLAVAGAGILVPLGRWCSGEAVAGQEFICRDGGSGLWTYLAVSGELDVPYFLGSASAYPRAGIGKVLFQNDSLHVRQSACLVKGIAVRSASAVECRDYARLPSLGFWPGPQWDHFSEDAKRVFTATVWRVSPMSDRVGYRLEGPPLDVPKLEMASEPVLCGSVQVPSSGLPLVTMRDGPTLGGYPKIALVDEGSLDWLAQCRPGMAFSFQQR